MAKDIEVEIFLTGGKKFEKDVKNTGKAADKASDGFSNAQASLVTLSAGFALVSSAARGALRIISVFTDIGRAALEAGVDFEEANQKFGVVFAGVIEESRTMREELVKNFGLSTLAATELLSATGDLLTGFGFTDKAALDLSVQVQRLAVDLASFSNVQGGAARVSRIVTKSLLGEREGLKELGIAVLEADVNQRILLKGQENLTGSSLRQAKAVAVLELAYEQSAKAIGDFERTSQSLANQQRILDARVKDLSVQLGQVLIPIMKIITAETVNLVTSISEWVEANKNIIASNIIGFTQLLTKALVIAADAGFFVIQSFNQIVKVLQIVKTGFATLAQVGTQAVALIINGFAIFASSITKLINDPLNTIKKTFVVFALEINEILEDVIDFGSALIPDSVIAGVKSNVTFLQKELAKINQVEVSGENPITTSLKGLSEELKKNAALIGVFKDETADSVIQTENNIEAIEGLREKFKDSARSIVQDLGEIRKAADAGGLFQQNLLQIAAGVEAEKRAAEEKKQIAAEELQAKREAITIFNEFRNETEEQQIIQAQERAALRLEGLTAALEGENQAKLNESLLAIEIKRQEEEEIFAIQEAFAKKKLSSREKKAKAELAQKKREEVQLLSAEARLLGGLASLSASFGAKAFKITKSLRIGEALVNTYAAANQALATLPPPASFIAAAASIVTGLANVNTIRQQKGPRAQHGITEVSRAEQPALLHLGESVLTRDETGILQSILSDINTGTSVGGNGGGVNVTLEVENLTLLADDDEAIGNLTEAITRKLEEQNFVGLGT